MDIGKIILIAGGAFIAYELFIAPAAATTTTTAPAGGIIPTPTPTPVVNPATTAQMVQNIANAQNPPFTIGTPYQWDYYYTQARGIQPPDPGGYLTPAQQTENMTFPEWWALASAHGLSGYKRTGYNVPGLGPQPSSLWIMENQ